MPMSQVERTVGTNQSEKRFCIIFSLWLVPTKNDTDYLRKIIDLLSRTYHAPSFQPHLTLYGTIDAPREKITGIVEKVIHDVKPMNVETEKIACSDIFFKTLFIQMKQSPILLDLFSRLQKEFSLYSDYTFNPHISLLYKTMPYEEKKKTANSLTTKPVYSFDRVFITTTEDITKGWYDIEHWRVVKKYLLK